MILNGLPLKPGRICKKNTEPLLAKNKIIITKKIRGEITTNKNDATKMSQIRLPINL